MKLFFDAPPDVWDVVRDRRLDVILTNQTGGTARDSAYPIQALSLSERGTELCPTDDEPWWVDLFIQREDLGFSPGAGWSGYVREISVLGGVGETPSVTFYAAIASNLPEDLEYRVQGWSFGARLTGDLDMVNATVDGTTAENADYKITYDLTPFLWINPYTGLPQGKGLVAAVVLDWDREEEPGEARDLPAVGTSTILAITVSSGLPLCSTCEITGEFLWQEGMKGINPESGRGNRFPVQEVVTLQGQSYDFCLTEGVRINFRPGWIPLLVLRPDGPSVTIPGLDLSHGPSICQFIDCPPPGSGNGGAAPDLEPAFDPEPDFEPGFSLYFPFTELELRHPTGAPFFQPGDWDLRVWDPDGQIAPIELRLFREDAIDRGSGIVGDEPDEGVVLFFAFPPGFAETATGVSLHLDVANRTLGTPREGSYRLDAIGYGAMPRQASGGSFRRGDSNGDTEVDLSDALRTLGYLFLGAEPPDCPDAADANDDAVIDISDAVGTLGFLFLGSAAPPAPGPFECGGDPTGDELGACAPCPGA